MMPVIRKVGILATLASVTLNSAAFAEEGPVTEAAECGVAEFTVTFNSDVCGFDKKFGPRESCGVTHFERQSLKCPGHEVRTYWGKFVNSSGNPSASDAYCRGDGPFSEPGSFHQPTGRKREESRSISGGRGFFQQMQTQFECTAIMTIATCRHPDFGIEVVHSCDDPDPANWVPLQCEAGKIVTNRRFNQCAIWKTTEELDSYLKSEKEFIESQAAPLSLSVANYYSQLNGQSSFSCMIDRVNSNPLFSTQLESLKQIYRTTFAKDHVANEFNCQGSQPVTSISSFQCNSENEDSLICQNAKFFQNTKADLERRLNDLNTKFMNDVVPRTVESYKRRLEDLKLQMEQALVIQ